MPISFGFLAGLGAALSWGTMDVATALASRRLGSLKVTAGIQVVGAVLLVALAFGQGTSLPSDPWSWRRPDCSASSAPPPTCRTSRACASARSRWSPGSLPHTEG